MIQTKYASVKMQKIELGIFLVVGFACVLMIIMVIMMFQPETQCTLNPVRYQAIHYAEYPNTVCYCNSVSKQGELSIVQIGNLSSEPDR